MLYIGLHQLSAQGLPVSKAVSADAWGTFRPLVMDHALHALELGSRVSLVAALMSSDGTGCTMCKGISPEQTFRLHSQRTLPDGIYSCYDLVLKDWTNDMPNCATDEHSRCYRQEPLNLSKPMVLFDLCAGIGGFSLGSRPLGIQTHLLWDKNPLACSLLKNNFTAPVFEGPLEDMQLLKQAHSLRSDAILQISGGFPCQPFSTQGDGAGFQDSRSLTLNALLRTIWHLRAEVALLECVASVAKYPEVLDLIETFAKINHMNVKTVTFDLADQWPAKRERFWCLLSNQNLPNFSLSSWNTGNSFRCIGDVFFPWMFVGIWRMNMI